MEITIFPLVEFPKAKLLPNYPLKQKKIWVDWKVTIKQKPIPLLSKMLYFLSERAKEDTIAGRFSGLNDEQWEIWS